MAGGTGGHVMPALAVAAEMNARGWGVVWLGTQAGIEARLVPAAGYEIEWVSVSGVRGKGLVKALLLPVALLMAFYQALRALLRRRPDVVLGMGGYAAFPGGMMAVLLGRPLVIHEQNSVAGLTNRVLALLADRVLAGFPDAFSRATGNRLAAWIPSPKAARVEWVGNPVRRDIAAVPPPAERFADRAGPLRLLVVGGSQGAQALNDTVPAALAALAAAERPEVVHQAGERHIEALRARYAALAVQAQPMAFIDDMASRYAWCDLLVCRAGALTVAEIAAAGVASILVPFPAAVDDHQTGNARFLADAGAAWLMPQGELTAERLAERLTGLTRAVLQKMAEKARALARPEATRWVADRCVECAG